MYFDIQQCKVLKAYVSVLFEDGKSGTVKFQPEFFTGVFAPLKDYAQFQTLYLEVGVLTWPCHVDIAPETVYHEIAKSRIALLK